MAAWLETGQQGGAAPCEQRSGVLPIVLHAQDPAYVTKDNSAPKVNSAQTVESWAKGIVCAFLIPSICSDGSQLLSLRLGKLLETSLTLRLESLTPSLCQVVLITWQLSSETQLWIIDGHFGDRSSSGETPLVYWPGQAQPLFLPLSPGEGDFLCGSRASAVFSRYSPEGKRLSALTTVFLQGMQGNGCGTHTGQRGLDRAKGGGTPCKWPGWETAQSG